MRYILNNSRKKTLYLLVFSLLLLNILLIFIVDPIVLFSLVYTIIIFVIISFFLVGKDSFFKNLFVLQVYILLAILLFCAQRWIMPGSKGFSGMYGGVGTDDSKFYAEITKNTFSIPSYASGYIGLSSYFVSFLKVLYPFNVNQPLSIIIPNLLGISFIPYFTQKVSNRLVEDVRVGQIAFILVMFDPVILSNGLILMRDGWTAFLLIIGVYYLLEKKIIQYLITLMLLSYLRLGSGLLLAVVPIFYFRGLLFSGPAYQKALKIIALIILVLLFFGIGFPYIMEYLVMKGVSGFGREEFVETFIRTLDSNSTIYHIYTLPFYLKLPIGFIFFFLLPFLKLQFYTLGIFNIRFILFTTIMPVFSIAYFKYLISGVVFSFKKNAKMIKQVFYIYTFLILLISQVSIQPRHKTTIMPLFYILVAYGIYNNNKLSRQLGTVFVVFLGIIQFYFIV